MEVYDANGHRAAGLSATVAGDLLVMARAFSLGVCHCVKTSLAVPAESPSNEDVRRSAMQTHPRKAQLYVPIIDRSHSSAL